MNLVYQDTVTFVETTQGVYANDKTVVEQAQVPAIFLQNTGFLHANFQDNVDSDAICYPDPSDSFVTSRANRLEGLYILAPLFGATDDEGWYKVTSVTVNRDHLLTNQIDNILLNLKKTNTIPAVIS